MEDIKFAELNDEQLKEINKLEDKLNVTLIAYDSSVLGSQQNYDETPNLDLT